MSGGGVGLVRDSLICSSRCSLLLSHLLCALGGVLYAQHPLGCMPLASRWFQPMKGPQRLGESSLLIPRRLAATALFWQRPQLLSGGPPSEAEHVPGTASSFLSPAMASLGLPHPPILLSFTSPASR